MALKQNTAEGGSDGTGVTTGNSGGTSGDAFDAVTLNSGFVNYSINYAAHGSLSFAIQSPAASASYVNWTGFTENSFAARVYFLTTNVPAAATELIRVRSGGTAEGRIIINSTGKLGAQDTTGNVWTAATPLSLYTWYRLELVTIIGTTTGNGTILAAYYVGENATEVESFSTATANTGTASLTQVSIGKPANSNWADIFYMDELAIDNGATTFIGPYVGSPQPVAWLSQ